MPSKNINSMYPQSSQSDCCNSRATEALIAFAPHIWGQAVEKRGESCLSLKCQNFRLNQVCSLLNKLSAYGTPVGFFTYTGYFQRHRSIHVVVDDASFAVHGINADVPQVLAATLFLFHITNLLVMPDIFG